VRSFVRRQGRMTLAQERAFATLMDRHGVPAEPEAVDLSTLFGRPAPALLEIGFGTGEALIDFAQRHPHWNALGIEVHQPGVGRLLNAIENLALGHVRVHAEDAVPFLSQRLRPGQLDRIHVFFPDPWPKKRHQKRRLIQPAFIGLLCAHLKPDGVLHLATDWEEYAIQMAEVLMDRAELVSENNASPFTPRPPERPLTRFEQRGQRLGHSVWDLCFRRRLDADDAPVARLAGD
jgi:tRNA (guanine-N7-)-methyltransferase